MITTRGENGQREDPHGAGHQRRPGEQRRRGRSDMPGARSAMTVVAMQIQAERPAPRSTRANGDDEEADAVGVAAAGPAVDGVGAETRPPPTR